MIHSSRRIGIVISGVHGGGIERTCLALARTLAERGWQPDLVLLKFSGHYRSAIPDGVPIYRLEFQATSKELQEYCDERKLDVRPIRVGVSQYVMSRTRLRLAYPGLELRDHERRFAPLVAKYLRAAKPSLLFAAGPQANNTIVLATNALRHRVPTIVSIRTSVRNAPAYAGRRRQVARSLMPIANAVVAVSKGAGREASDVLGLDPDRVHVIYNPALVDEIRELSSVKVSHSWFGEGKPPVILSALREVKQKDWRTLVTAFALVRRVVPARLALLGRTYSREYQAQVMGLASDLGVKEDVEFLGFDENPFRYMSRARLFVHSSRWEGLGNVLVEAMACGTQVVSTDAPHGPAEILERGKWGRLTRVGDADALARAILETLSEGGPSSRALRHRAGDFAMEKVIVEYESLFANVLSSVEANGR